MQIRIRFRVRLYFLLSRLVSQGIPTIYWAAPTINKASEFTVLLPIRPRIIRVCSIWYQLADDDKANGDINLMLKELPAQLKEVMVKWTTECLRGGPRPMPQRTGAALHHLPPLSTLEPGRSVSPTRTQCWARVIRVCFIGWDREDEFGGEFWVRKRDSGRI